MYPRYLDEHELREVDDIRDMAQRVVNNGGEPCYAGEKLYAAVLFALPLLKRLGYSRTDILKAVNRPHAAHFCPTCLARENA